MSFCKAEVTSKYYKPMDPDMAKKIKLALAVVGFIIVLVLLVLQVKLYEIVNSG